MGTKRQTKWMVAAGLCAVLAAGAAYGNGGPFVVKYPNGDPAAKGILARLDPSLRPTRESELRVVKEDLSFSFGLDDSYEPESMPLASVSAAYTIENPTDKEIQVDFGFPILRGIYMNPHGMLPYPDVRILVDGKHVRPQIISNSIIYGIIRQQAKGIIEAGIAKDAKLEVLVAATREAGGIVGKKNRQPSQQSAKAAALLDSLDKERKSPEPTADYASAREALRNYLISGRNWNERDAALLVEYASMDLGETNAYPRDRWDSSIWLEMDETKKLIYANFGPLVAIGEQKATQFFARLAALFDEKAAATYEGIFTAWGGDVRERSIDLDSGNIRPREIELSKNNAKPGRTDRSDTTVYARLDYLDPNAKISDTEKASCEAVLKNLPVVFTFAPMNLLHYQVTFPAKKSQLVTVNYKQYAYLDTRGTPSYQLGYVLHPASMWDDFGPIQVTVQMPKQVSCRASTPLSPMSEEQYEKTLTSLTNPERQLLKLGEPKYPVRHMQARLEKNEDKTGEMFIGINKAEWDPVAKAEIKRIKDERAEKAKKARQQTP